MFEIRQTTHFIQWFEGLRDLHALLRINARIARLRQGHFGGAKAVGGEVSELRVHCDPGYRIYYTRSGSQIVVLLCGGNKDSQSRDIELAKRLAREWKE